ncbi:MAG TPA: DNA polymerase III subunit alpha [Bacteroidota bacterium]|nr:DNA polymerase III subunit alpha [Bacteroidota bacterium]
MPQFVHLHNHSHYSLLDAACRIEDLIHAAAADGMPAVALTDHGVLFGAVEFYKKATKAGIKPIIGMEAYIVTKGSRFEKSQQETESGGRRASYHHIVLLAKDAAGYRNLIKLCTSAHLEGYYYKPRIDTDILREHAGGLVALSACAGGVVSAHLAAGRDDEAYDAARIYREIFGDDFYIEIQNHGIEREKTVRDKAPKLARDLGLKLICTNDVHYLKHEHALAHNIMLLIPDASSTNTPDYTQFRYQTDQAYFKTSAEMHVLFKDYPEALASTLEVAEKCNLTLDLGTNHMPRFPIPPEAGAATLDEYFAALTREGFARRYPEAGEALRTRLEHEIGVISRMGYAGYFLIVQDFIRAARAMGVYVGPGRGSAAGSIASFALGITNVDPVKYDLLFERFLNPDRISMPDIDVDFSDSKRDMVIRYVREKYGEDSVSQIITFGTLSSRAVLKDVGRVLGIPLSTVESITKQIPVEQGKVRPLAEALETIPDLKWVVDSPDPKMHTLIEASLVLEGMNRNAGMHAAGVVIAPGTISDFVPLYKTPQTEVMTQYNMKDLETAGLLKMDFLGLRTLSVLENCLRLVAENHGVTIDLDAIPEDDAQTFALFTRGDTVAVFQFESSGMADWLRKLKPTSISDLVAMNALYRPGPMEMIGDFIARKHGTQKITYAHPALEPILRETYGVIVYQEQVMKIASEVAGFTLAKADLMRRAMGKKDKALMATMKKEFIDGAAGRGTARAPAGEIFDLIEKFASYGFNKSHAVAYSVISYQTGYLKAHYPAEFMAATLSSEIGSTDKIVKLIDDCRRMGIEVLPPDVNESGLDFTVVGGRIRFGLCAIKNVGESAIDTVIRARASRKKFANLFDFCSGVDLRLVNKKCLESLVQAGAFDSMGLHRAQYMENLERVAAFGQAVQSRELNGQSSLFDSGGGGSAPVQYPAMTPAPAWSESEKLAREKSVLGFYVSGHPLLRYEHEIKELANVRLGDLSGFRPNATVKACGIVTAVKKKIDKRNNTMAFVGIEDFTGKGECIVFADAYAKYQAILQVDAMVMVAGKGEANGDTLKILVNEVTPMEKVREKFTRGIILSIDLNDIAESTIVRLREVIEGHRGSCPCYFSVRNAHATTMFQTRRYAVDASGGFVDEIRQMLGPDSIRFTTQ